MELSKANQETDSNQPQQNVKKDEKRSNVSCYKVDGVLAHMEIEFEKESESVHSTFQDISAAEPEGFDEDSNECKSDDTASVGRKRGRPRKYLDSSKKIKTEETPLRSRGRPRKVEVKNSSKKEETIETPGRGRPRNVDIKSSSQKADADETPIRHLRKKAVPVIDISDSDPPKTNLKAKSVEQEYFVASKPKLYNLYPGKNTSLRSIPDVSSQIKKTHPKYLRHLFKVMYNDYPPKSEFLLVQKVLDFKGFGRMKASELDERQSSLKKLTSYDIVAISMIFGIEVGTNNEMISEIIKFLMKPVKCIMSPVDPFAPSMQPTLQLERISIDGHFIARSIKKHKPEKKKSIGSKPEPARKSIGEKKVVFTVEDDEEIESSKAFTPAEGKRKRFPSTRMKIYDVIGPNIDSISSQKSDVKPKVVEKRTSTPKKKPTDVKKDKKHTPITFGKVIPNKMFAGKESTKIESSEAESSVDDVTPWEDSDVEYVPETEKYKSILKDIDARSDITLSADESREETERVETRGRKKIVDPCPWIRPLSEFPHIKNKIMASDIVSLQRLHIFLFGAPDEKADRLKLNILAFGGFPFQEGSDEWKQKEFVFSLTSLSDIKEHMDLLCIDYEEDEDQNSLIKKLMRFLASPSDNKNPSFNTRVVSSQLVKPVKTEPSKTFSSNKSATKSKNTKPAAKGKKSNPRKVLMDEDEVRRMERDFAREQRILARERKLLVEKSGERLKPTTPTPNPHCESMRQQTDTQLLNALLQTVYKRRALKMAGAKISVPNKGVHTRLGELDNVKFLIVTANHNDLDVLHHLIYMTEATRSRVRKNILDFAGFNFAEDSVPYQDRMSLLQSLGYDIAKRIGFLLGLCPFKMNIPAQDLYELIMYFLMSPCKSKQIPIRHLPANFFNNDMPQELTRLVQKHDHALTITPGIKAAKKSFPTSSSSTPLRPVANALVPNIFSRTPVTKLPQIKPTEPIPFPDSSDPKTPQVIQIPQEILKGSTLAKSGDTAIPQEFLIQQKTPDGQQKTYKLVKLPSSHPLNAALKTQKSKVLPPSNQPMVAGPPLPPGVVVFKNDEQAVPYFAQSVSSVDKSDEPMDAESSMDSEIAEVVMNVETSVRDEPVESTASEEEDQPISDDEITQGKSPVQSHKAPSKQVLYNKIKEIILKSNFEDITLRNVIQEVSAQFPLFDLKPLHTFMKESVKKIIVCLNENED